ncbi:MAG: polysaccharide pyruvyl transferase family protein [bacterium]|nr:polysaccharide pyruvyl transferase family protein [bacterium]
MRIGILTHHYINNFGAFLQTYALQETLKKLFPSDEIYVINYINRIHFITNTLGWFRFYMGKENVAGWIEKTKLPMTFEKVRKRYLNLTKKVTFIEEINKMDFDTIVIGSDEVWNYTDKKADNPVKFGKGLNCKNIISYAPSCGQAFSKAHLPEYAENELKRFTAVSARDSDTYEMLKSIGLTAERVIDPTFLTELNTEPMNMSKPYILFYYCDNMPESAFKEIIDYAKSNGLKLYGAGECNKVYDELTINLTPFEWIDMFKNASAVVTGTFHGAVFSIINRRDFVCYMSNPSRIAKVNSLLDEFNLSERKISDNSAVSLLKNKIDYDKVYEIIDEKKKKSIEFLKESIDNERKKDHIIRS